MKKLTSKEVILAAPGTAALIFPQLNLIKALRNLDREAIGEYEKKVIAIPAVEVAMARSSKTKYLGFDILPSMDDMVEQMEIFDLETLDSMTLNGLVCQKLGLQLHPFLPIPLEFQLVGDNVHVKYPVWMLDLDTALKNSILQRVSDTEVGYTTGTVHKLGDLVFGGWCADPAYDRETLLKEAKQLFCNIATLTTGVESVEDLQSDTLFHEPGLVKTILNSAVDAVKSITGRDDIDADQIISVAYRAMGEMVLRLEPYDLSNEKVIENVGDMFYQLIHFSDNESRFVNVKNGIPRWPVAVGVNEQEQRILFNYRKGIYNETDKITIGDKTGLVKQWYDSLVERVVNTEVMIFEL